VEVRVRLESGLVLVGLQSCTPTANTPGGFTCEMLIYYYELVSCDDVISMDDRSIPCFTLILAFLLFCEYRKS